MLERATSCLESAGRHLLRDPNSVLRSRKSLPSRSWMHSSTKADIPRWFLALVQVTGQRPSPIPNTGHGKGASDGGLFLDFLCPQQSPSRMGSSLPRPQKKLAARRRRPNAGFLRSYTSASGTEQAISMEDTAADQTEQHSEESLEPQYSSRNEDPTLEDRTLEDRTLEDPMLEDPTFEDPTLEELHWTLQDPTSDHFDKVWDLYLEAGSPPEYNSEVLYYLSRSPNSQHQEWAWIVFQNIPHSERTNRNYGHIIGSQYLSEPPWVAPHVISICKQALSTPLAGPCIVWNLLYAAKSGNWSQISEIWSLTSEIESDPALHLTVLDAFKKNSFLAKGLLGLVEYLELEKGDQRLLALARLFFDQVLADNSLLSAVTTSDLLQVLEKYRHIRSLEESDYIEVIARLNTSDAWPESVRSIFFYRQFRLEIPNWHPPKKLLTCLFDRAVAFEMLDSILYLLEELAHFEKKPSIAAYREALQAFSKAGDVHKVHYIFDRLVADYGNPKSRRLLSPLLVVHAQVGDVYETQRHFDRISAEFGLRPNTICWNILIQTYVAAGDASGAASVLTRMLNQNETPSSHTYGTIMGLFARRNDLLNVRQLFYQAKSSNVEITLPMARMLLQAYLKNDDYEQAEKLIFDYWQSVSGATPMALFNTRLRHHASRVEKRYFTRILGAADALGLEPDAGTYAAIMYAHVITRQSGEARTVLLKMVAAGIEPTEVHYSLLMLAYLSHGNHNMVNATFREMQARLGKGRKDARIVYLKTQLERDIWNAKMTDTLAEDVSFPYSEEALRASTNVDSDPTPPKILPLHASGSPEPHALTLHYHNMIKAYGSVSTVEKTHEALDHYLQSRPSTISRDQKMAELPFDLIKYLMLAHLKVEEFTVVEQYWNNLWPRIISFATRVDPDQFFSADSARAGREAAERAAIEDAEAAAKRVADLEIAVVQEYNKFEELNFTPGVSHSTMLAAEDQAAHVEELLKRAKERDAAMKKSAESPTAMGTKPEIVRGQQFILDFPLSMYMQSLAGRKKYARLHQIVSEVQALGFTLTAKNWSTYIELLTLSEELSDQLKAFQLFEEKFEANFPGWEFMRRGYGLRPAGSPESILHLENFWDQNVTGRVMGRRARRRWWRIRPDYMHPSYRTIVYLGTRLQEIREQSIIKGSVNFSDFITTAPKTLRIIADMPYLNDQYQKQLLRGFTGSPIRFPEGPPLDPGNNPKVKLNLPPLGTPFEPPTRPEVNPYEEESSKEESSEDSPELKTPMWHLYNMKAGWNAASVPNPNRDAMPFNPRGTLLRKTNLRGVPLSRRTQLGAKEPLPFRARSASDEGGNSVHKTL